MSISEADLWKNLHGYLTLKEKATTSSACKIWRDLFYNTLHSYTLPYIEQDMRSMWPINNNSAVLCLAKCGFAGSEQNKGFCSVCVKKNKPSEVTLNQFKALQDAKTKAANKAKEDEESKKQALFRLLGKLKNLKSFNSCYMNEKTLDNCKQGNRKLPFDLSFLGGICGSSLQCLILSVDLTDDILIAISRSFSNLVHLDLNDCSVTETKIKTWKCLNKLTKLEHLNITCFPEDEEEEEDEDEDEEKTRYIDLNILQSLSALKNLKVLSAMSAHFGDESWDFLLNYPKLEAVTFAFPRFSVVSQKTFKPLTQLPHLRYANLRSMPIRDKDLPTLSLIPSLEYLILQDCELSAGAIEQYIKPMKHLKAVGLAWCGSEHDKIKKCFRAPNESGEGPILCHSGRCSFTSEDWVNKLTPCSYCKKSMDPMNPLPISLKK